MPLLTKTDLQTLQYVQDGSPSCQIAAKSGSTPNNLDIVEDGSPFWFLPDVTITELIKSISGILWTGIKKIGGVTIANLKKIGGISKN